MVDDVTVATGRYPDRTELRRLAGLGDDLGLSASTQGCCSSTAQSTGCC
ncbi:arsenic metallochaperone ArsD family protein [Tessaracoccus sp. HDW20]|nr:arsenic metallochaperone ArsD family protein [Tessaracoccus coleopterorum]NHB85070.1 arsenic metallochaperone ArsD family protein [Tessaracoccus coleopterorum]